MLILGWFRMLSCARIPSDILQEPDHQDRDDGGAVTFNQFDTTNYLHADNKADGSSSEQFILQVNAVEQNGAHVNLPGLGSEFGMYFIIDATLLPANGGPPVSANWTSG